MGMLLRMLSLMGPDDVSGLITVVVEPAVIGIVVVCTVGCGRRPVLVELVAMGIIVFGAVGYVTYAGLLPPPITIFIGSTYV